MIESAHAAPPRIEVREVFIHAAAHEQCPQALDVLQGMRPALADRRPLPQRWGVIGGACAQQMELGQPPRRLHHILRREVVLAAIHVLEADPWHAPLIHLDDLTATAGERRRHREAG